MGNKSNYHGGKKSDYCYFCGAFGNIEEHHVIPRRFGGSDSTGNIVDVCSSCHNKLERLYDRGFYEHFGIDDEKGERAFHRQCEMADCSSQAGVQHHSPAGVVHLNCVSCFIDRWEDDWQVVLRKSEIINKFLISEQALWSDKGDNWDLWSCEPRSSWFFKTDLGFRRNGLPDEFHRSDGFPYNNEIGVLCWERVILQEAIDVSDRARYDLSEIINEREDELQDKVPNHPEQREPYL